MNIKTLLAAVTLVGLLSAAQAQTDFVVSLDGTQAGITNTPGSGSGTLTLNLDNTVSYDISFQDLVGTTTAAHIHGPALPGEPAGIVEPLTFVAIGTTAGQLLGTTGPLSAPEVTDMLNGLYYVNIHTSFVGGGEIRGQIYQVPEPTTLSLAALAGLSGLMLYRLKRRC